jgi:hypothetical protein
MSQLYAPPPEQPQQPQTARGRLEGAAAGPPPLMMRPEQQLPPASARGPALGGRGPQRGADPEWGGGALVRGGLGFTGIEGMRSSREEKKEP